MHNLKMWTMCLNWNRPLHRQPSMQNIQTLVRKNQQQQRQKQPPLAVSLGHKIPSSGLLCINSLHHPTALWTYTHCTEEETEAQRGRPASEIWFLVLTFNPDLYQFCDPSSHELFFLDELSWVFYIFLVPFPQPAHPTSLLALKKQPLLSVGKAFP